MTIKEIAELCGVDKTTVYRWVEKDDFLSCEMQLRKSIIKKNKKGSPEKPSDFSLEETLAIIGDGGGNKTLAALLEENSRNKNALSIEARTGIVQTMSAFNQRLDRIEKTLEELSVIKSAVLRLTDGLQGQVSQNRSAELDEDICLFYKNHIDDTVSRIIYTKAINLWELFKYEYPNKYRKAEFMERFKSMYRQFTFERYKSVDVFWGFRLFDTRGVC